MYPGSSFITFINSVSLYLPTANTIGDSLKVYRDWKNTIDTAHIKGHEEGEAIGIKKGREEGEAIGVKKGREEGEAIGVKKGREEGEAIGVKKGREEAKKQMIMQMLAYGMSDDEVCKLAHISKEELHNSKELDNSKEVDNLQELHKLE